MRHQGGSSLEPTAAAPSAERCCVGIVIPLPEALACELERWRASFGDPMAAVVRPHITLVTGAETADWDSATEHVRGVAAAGHPFTVRLSGTGTFRPVSPVVFLNVAEGWDECVDLHTRLQAGPLDRVPEFEFHPHLTVAQDVTETGMDHAMDVLADFEAEFTVDRIGLFQHDGDGLWSLREELQLGGEAQA